MKRKNTYLNKIYEEFETKYASMEGEDYTNAINDRIAELESNVKTIDITAYDQKMLDLQKVIDENEVLLKKLGEEDNSKIAGIVEQAKAEIEQAKKNIEAIQAERDTAQNESLKAEKENIMIQKQIEQFKSNARGFSKNKNQIQRIRQYKGTLETKLNTQIQSKNNSLAAIQKAKAEIENVSNQLSNETITMNLDNNSYNVLLLRKQAAEKSLSDNQQIYNNAKVRILELKTKIAKCDMAWKSLFTDKDWDCINVRAVEMGSKYERKTPEDEEKLTKKKDSKEEEPVKKVASKEDIKVQQSEPKVQINDQTINGQPKEEQENQSAKPEDKDDEKGLKEYKRFSWRNIWNRIVGVFRSGVSQSSYEDLGYTQSKQDDDVQEPILHTDDTQEPILHTTSSTETQHDEFIEGLRKYASREKSTRENMDNDTQQPINDSQEQDEDREDR